MSRFPKDCSQRRIGEEARSLVHYKLPKNHWEFHEYTGTDHGVDCVIELVENEEYHNHKFEGQIKGSIKPKYLQNENAISFPMDTKTINYGLSSRIAFVLLFVDIETEIVYYIPIQDYFISKPSLFDKLTTEQKTINIHIPCDNTISKDDFDLIQVAKSVYINGPSRDLKRIQGE